MKRKKEFEPCGIINDIQILACVVVAVAIIVLICGRLCHG